MTVRSQLLKILQQEDINFLLTNRIPRQLLTRFVGWLARIEQPLVRDLSLAIWRAFADLDLSEARKTSFTSVRDCFTRELKEGARTIDADPGIVTSPCDAIVGAHAADRRHRASPDQGLSLQPAGSARHGSSSPNGTATAST